MGWSRGGCWLRAVCLPAFLQGILDGMGVSPTDSAGSCQGDARVCAKGTPC